jgi:hypothetical protein
VARAKDEKYTDALRGQSKHPALPRPSAAVAFRPRERGSRSVANEGYRRAAHRARSDPWRAAAATRAGADAAIARGLRQLVIVASSSVSTEITASDHHGTSVSCHRWGEDLRAIGATFHDEDMPLR